MKNDGYKKGRGAQFNPSNKFDKHQLDLTPGDGIDEYVGDEKPKVQVFLEHPKKVLNEVNSPDVPGEYSLNAYQGCEHGCVYCYARETHQFWGFSAGLDFESKIVVKENAPELLRKEFMKKTYKPGVVLLSGNTDCYQPLEAVYKLTRRILEIMLEFRNPVSIITKNALVTRDADVLEELAKENLVNVIFSVTTADESLRRVLEPRTATFQRKMEAIGLLSERNIPVGVMTAPIIPGLNQHEIPNLLKSASAAGARWAGYSVVRLNGEIGDLFTDWLEKNFPDRKQKVLHQIEELHGGNIQDRRFGTRVRGEGESSKVINQLFKVARSKYFESNTLAKLDVTKFRRGGALTLF